MKKIIPLILVIALCGCSKKVNTKDVKLLAGYNLAQIEENGIVYVEGPYILTPYYSPNGKLCVYIDGQLKEVD